MRPPAAGILYPPPPSIRPPTPRRAFSVVGVHKIWPHMYIEYRVGVWKCPRRLPPDPSPNISGPMGAQFLSSVGLGFGTLIGKACPPNTCVFPVEPQSPKQQKRESAQKVGFGQFQKERLKVRKSAFFEILVQRSGFTHFRALFPWLNWKYTTQYQHWIKISLPRSTCKQQHFRFCSFLALSRLVFGHFSANAWLFVLVYKQPGGPNSWPVLATLLAWYKCLHSQNAQKCLREGAKRVFGPLERESQNCLLHGPLRAQRLKKSNLA